MASPASPKYADGARQHPWGIVAALLAGWTLLPIALWGAALGGLIGFFVGVIDALRAINTAHQYGISEGIGWLSVIGHTTGGILIGFWAIYGGSITAAPGTFLLALFWGAVAALLITFGYWTLESWILQLQGCRRMSKREAEVVDPVYAEIAKRMGVAHPPPIVVKDRHPGSLPEAYTHLRTIVLYPAIIGWLRKDEERGQAVLAHELEHYRRGHVYGLRLVWAAAFPVVMMHSLAIYLANHRAAQGGTIVADYLAGVAYFLFWPAVVLMRFLVNPIAAHEGRNHEYICDAAAVQAGYGAGMLAALETFAATSGGAGSGWDKIVLATHPPLELRIERVLDAIDQPGDALPAPSAPEPEPIEEFDEVPERITASVAPRRRARKAAPTATAGVVEAADVVSASAPAGHRDSPPALPTRPPGLAMPHDEPQPPAPPKPARKGARAPASGANRLQDVGDWAERAPGDYTIHLDPNNRVRARGPDEPPPGKD